MVWWMSLEEQIPWIKGLDKPGDCIEVWEHNGTCLFSPEGSKCLSIELFSFASSTEMCTSFLCGLGTAVIPAHQVHGLFSLWVTPRFSMQVRSCFTLDRSGKGMLLGVARENWLEFYPVFTVPQKGWGLAISLTVQSVWIRCLLWLPVQALHLLWTSVFGPNAGNVATSGRTGGQFGVCGPFNYIHFLCCVCVFLALLWIFSSFQHHKDGSYTVISQVL